MSETLERISIARLALMAIDTTPYSQCHWCGSAYRPSHFDRQCSCPACGHALDYQRSETPALRPFRHAYTAAGLLILVSLGALVLRPMPRLPMSGAAPAPVQPSDVPPPFVPSEEFREAVAKKANLLEQDLALAPDDRFLLASLAETYLYRALAEDQVAENPAQAKRWLHRATEYQNRLQGFEPFASFRLREAIRRFPNLRFSTAGWPSVTASLWRLQAGKANLFAAPPPGGVPFIRRRRDVTGLPPSDNFAAGASSGSSGLIPGPPPTAPRGIPFFGDRAPAPAPAPVPPGYPGASVPPMNGSGAFGEGLPISGPDAPRLAEPGAVTSDDMRLTQLRQLLVEHPNDVLVADRLAGELLRVSAAYQPAAPQNGAQLKARKQIEEAAAIFERTAATTRLRVQRAAFYASAADARRRLEQWEAQYALLHQAAENVPFAPAVWHDLKSAALRIGKLDESLTASKNEDRWRFPGVEPVDIPTR